LVGFLECDSEDKSTEEEKRYSIRIQVADKDLAGPHTMLKFLPLIACAGSGRSLTDVAGKHQDEATICPSCGLSECHDHLVFNRLWGGGGLGDPQKQRPSMSFDKERNTWEHFAIAAASLPPPLALAEPLAFVLCFKAHLLLNEEDASKGPTKSTNIKHDTSTLNLYIL